MFALALLLAGPSFAASSHPAWSDAINRCVTAIGQADSLDTQTYLPQRDWAFVDRNAHWPQQTWRAGTFEVSQVLIDGWRSCEVSIREVFGREFLDRAIEAFSGLAERLVNKGEFRLKVVQKSPAFVAELLSNRSNPRGCATSISFFADSVSWSVSFLASEVHRPCSDWGRE